MKNYSTSQLVVTVIVIVCLVVMSVLVFTKKVPPIPDEPKDYVDCTNDPDRPECIKPIPTITPCVDNDGSCKKG